MKKKILVLATLMMTLAMCSTAFAAGWIRTTNGEKYAYDENNKEFYENCWQWIDANNDGIAECYCFGPDGYIYADTTTPDGYTVDANGAWTIDGAVQEKTVAVTEEAQPEEEAAPEETEVSAEEEEPEVGPSIEGTYYLIGTDRNGDYSTYESGVDYDCWLKITIKDEDTVSAEDQGGDDSTPNPMEYTKVSDGVYSAYLDVSTGMKRGLDFTTEGQVAETTYFPDGIYYISNVYKK